MPLKLHCRSKTPSKTSSKINVKVNNSQTTKEYKNKHAKGKAYMYTMQRHKVKGSK